MSCYGLLTSQEIYSVIMQYIVYGAIFVLGLVVLFFMKRRSRRPVIVLAVEKTEAAIGRTEKLLESTEKKGGEYAFPARLMQLGNEVGDLVVLADRELTENRNITYEGVLSAYQAAADKLAAIDVWDAPSAAKGLAGVKADLERALGILRELTKTNKKQTTEKA